MTDGLLLPIILQVVGVVVIIAEIILPSGGLLSILAAGIIGYSLYAVFTGVSQTAGIVFVAADVVIIPVAIIAGLKLLAASPATLRRTLSRRDGVVAQAPELAVFVDQRGVAATDLRPSGRAVIGGARVDVVTRGEYLERGTALVVAAVTGNQIIVRKAEANPQTQGEVSP